MSLLYQNDPRLSELIAGNGCELLCTIAIPCRYVNRYVTPAKVLSIADYCIKEGQICPDLSLCHETSPHAVMQETLRELSIVDVHGHQVGSIIDGLVTWWKWYGGNKFDYAIHRGYLDIGGPHSVLLDNYLQEIYNPYPTKRIARRGFIFLYRVMPTADWKTCHE